MEKVVRIFRSFREADEANDRERRAMTPEERVEVFLELQQRALPNGVDERLERVCRVTRLEDS